MSGSCRATPGTALDPGRDPGRGVLITRPEPGLADTAARVAALGWHPIAAPALTLLPHPLRAPARAQALLLTSAAAVASAAAAAPPGLRTFAVGAATAAAARSAGLAAHDVADGDARALAELVTRRLDPRGGPLWLAMGEGYGEELAAMLEARGFSAIRGTAYAAAPAGTLPAAARQALGAGQAVAALFFSPRSAECAISALRAAGLADRAAALAAIALSPRVAEAARVALAPASWAAMLVAARPDQDSLLERLKELGPADGPRRGTR